jgi:HEPN domain-containing protein
MDEIAKESIKIWIKKAENDLLNVKNNLSSIEIPADTVCFHCQQAVEKLLKAVFILLNIKIERTHDLEVLINQIIEKDNDFQKIREWCYQLDGYSVETRYPQGLEIFEPSVDEAKEAFEIALKIRDFILKKLTI